MPLSVNTETVRSLERLDVSINEDLPGRIGIEAGFTDTTQLFSEQQRMTNRHAPNIFGTT